MKLYTLKIEGFRRHLETDVTFSSASFLIGENNTGKSGILQAVELLLTDDQKIPDTSFFSYMDNEELNMCKKIVLTAEFRDVPRDASNWRGFKGRVFPYTETNPNGVNVQKNSIFYRKTFEPNTVRVIEMKARDKTIKDSFKDSNTIDSFISHGFPQNLLVSSNYENDDTKKKMNKVKKDEFLSYFESDFEFFDYSEEEVWVKNPGGIAGNVMSKLPRVLYIPAHDGSDNLGEKKGTFQEILDELFTDVRNESENYKQAQIFLNKLAEELNPEDGETEFGKMMLELNNVLDGVFSGIGLNALAQLNDADSAIKPTFSVSMTSNIPTTVSMQGTGVIRSTVFALLRYKAVRDAERANSERSLIICFEEPEIYLHPNAANQMRDTIYNLATTGNNQIICTTHSPYMIDLSKKTGQVLNYLSLSSKELIKENGDDFKCDVVNNKPFNIQKAFRSLQEDEKDYLKLILKMDDYLSRIFFAQNVLIVEGDTEEIVLKETISIMPENMRKNILANWQIIRARGKATIISLVKYLKSMGITPYVMHDLDLQTPGASIMNEPIRLALDDDRKLFGIENSIEDILGYQASSKDKPYKALKFIQENWNNDYAQISDAWKRIIESIFI